MFIDFAQLYYMIKYTFNHLFKLVEPAGNKEEKMLKYDIGIALGKIRIKQNINMEFKSFLQRLISLIRY